MEYCLGDADGSATMWSAGDDTDFDGDGVLDAVGLAAFAVVGAAKSLGYGNDPVVAVAMGVLTATFGGIVRDVHRADTRDLRSGLSDPIHALTRDQQVDPAQLRRGGYRG